MGEATCLIKIVLLGDAQAGKSALMQAYTKATVCDPSGPYTPTRGVEFCSGHSEALGQRLQFQIWDTAGDSRFRAPTPKYCGKAAGVACVFDITNRASFESCERWLMEAREVCGPEIAWALVAAKTDLLGHTSVLQEVSSAEGRKFAKDHGVQYYETSSVTDCSSVQRFFGQFITLALQRKNGRVGSSGEQAGYTVGTQVAPSPAEDSTHEAMIQVLLVANTQTQ